ncbi:transposase [Terribacillus saccharophilus]|uniref:transposase n=1 Tax=Terribacillus saccharophilus TaxID=361277 RepID=UPI0014740E85|nr:transposase [Terribacillus goriensis]
MTFKKYSDEFKLQVISEVKESYYLDCKRIAVKHGININTIKNWTLKFSSPGLENTSESNQVKKLRDEIKRKDIEIRVLEGLLTKKLK